MTDWIFLKYIFLLINVKILSENPTQSQAVDYLIIFASIVGGVLFLKLLFHNRVYTALKRDYAKLDREVYPQIVKMVKTLSKKIGLTRLPDLYLFENKYPLVFTIGIMTPSIFISPILIKALQPDELSAVLTHEIYHIKRKDALITVLLQGILVFIPFVPIFLFGRYMVFEKTSVTFWISASLMMLISYSMFLRYFVNKKREFVCDDLTSGSLEDPLLLAHTIIKVWKINTDIPRYSWNLKTAYVKPFLFSGRNQNSRVLRLINLKTSIKRVSGGGWIKLWIPATAVFCAVFIFKYVEIQNKINIISPGLLEQNSRAIVVLEKDMNSPKNRPSISQKFEFEKIHVFKSGIFFQGNNADKPGDIFLDSKTQFQFNMRN